MGEWLQKYITQLRELWENLNNRAKIIIGILVLAMIVAFIFLIMAGGSSNYKPLFGDLSSQDANAIVERLKEQNIEYKLADNGSTILVPENAVHETRLDMAGEGLPDQGMVGFEIFDQTNFGTTDFERQDKFSSAIGGEMSRTIQNMDIIEYARVQVTAPQESLYIEEEKPSEASVLLRLKPGYNISQTEISAISNLVAGGVQGLTTNNVTIVDTNGNLLSDTSSENGINTTEMTSNQFQMQRNFENKLKTDLRSMLIKVLGPGNFTVQVNAKLNFDQRETESKSYSPVVDDQGIVRSQESQQVSQEGQTGTAEGVPGVEENVPQEQATQYQGEDGETQSSSYESSNTVTNYEINEKIETHKYAPGDVEQLSVSVILNNEQDEETVTNIRNAVQAAIGYQEERNDQVNVTSMQFNDNLEEEASQAQLAAQAENRRQMYIYGGLIAFILLALIATFFILRRSQRDEEYETGQSVDMMVGEGEEVKPPEEELSEEEKERRRMKEEIEELVNDRPGEIAQLLKSWLEQE